MDYLKVYAVSLGASVGVPAILYARAYFWTFSPTYEISPPPGKVAIILPTLNEEFWLPTALESLNSQRIVEAYPQYFEKIVVDSESEDNTVAVAESYGWKVISAPRGKLTARDLAIRNTEADIIISVDADAYYPPNTIALLLEHFNDPQVVGVTGSTIYAENFFLKFFSPIVEYFGYGFFWPDRMMGRLSAFRRDAYFEVGGFDLSIDQTDWRQMIEEEEFGFWNRLSKIGKVVHDRRAVCYTARNRLFWQQLKQTGASLPEPIDKYLEEIESNKRF